MNIIQHIKVQFHSTVRFKWKLVFVIILIFFIITVSGNIRRVHIFNKEISNSEKELEELQQEHRSLEQELRYISSDSYKEIQIRDKLGLSKEGEVVVVLPDESTLRKLSPRILISEPSYQVEPNYYKWFNVFF